MRFCVIQPGYFSAIPVLGRALAADVIVWADSFTFNKHSEINRTVIKTIAGPKWLTIPVFSTPDSGAPISAMRIDNHEKWQQKHRRTLEINYRNAAYYHFYCENLQTVYNHDQQLLEQLLWSSFLFLTQQLHITAKIVKSSALPHRQDRSERALCWGKELACDTYLFAAEERNFIARQVITLGGMNLHSFSLTPFSYYQQYDDILFPLSILDLIFNEGPAAASLLIKNSHINTEC
ncbi:MAG TPA: WbqC family protein [bacterium]|nr:WbqC family protein [bacterium]HPN42640.1 WbqC family protein [bacterium]